ncbi:type II RES/Xre toxin-antitoxin system antitoxin [Aquirufa sp. TARAVU-A1A]
MKNAIDKPQEFNVRKSVLRAQRANLHSTHGNILDGSREYTWNSNLGKMKIIRKGVSYDTIEVLSIRIQVPIKEILSIVGIPQTTYNSKKKDNVMMNPRDSELVLQLAELFDYGLDVFNQEEGKFKRWLKKKNDALGGGTPESFLDSNTGILEVRNCLNRLEYGNLA